MVSLLIFFFNALMLVALWECELAPLTNTGKDYKLTTDFEMTLTFSLARAFALVLSFGDPIDKTNHGY